MRTDERQYMVRVDEGEEVVASLVAFAGDHDVRCAAVTGLGGVGATRLAYFCTERKEYLPRDFDGVHELVSLVGNLGVHEGAPFLHAHVVLSDREFRCFGGHLMESVVAITAEFAVRVGDGTIERVANPRLGIKEQQLRGGYQL
ncbi:MAG: PPC domain-containing DNA-binding protein [Planctomycetota bacterium JB042]